MSAVYRVRFMNMFREHTGNHIPLFSVERKGLLLWSDVGDCTRATEEEAKELIATLERTDRENAARAGKATS